MCRFKNVRLKSEHGENEIHAFNEYITSQKGFYVEKNCQDMFGIVNMLALNCYQERETFVSRKIPPSENSCILDSKEKRG